MKVKSQPQKRTHLPYFRQTTPCVFLFRQKEELNVYEAGYALAAEHCYQPYSSKKHIGKPVHASGFVAGFMYRAFVGNDPIWIRQSTMSSEFVDAIEQGWTAGHTLEAQYKGHSYEANEDDLPSVFRLPSGGVSCDQVFLVLSHAPILQKLHR